MNVFVKDFLFEISSLTSSVAKKGSGCTVSMQENKFFKKLLTFNYNNINLYHISYKCRDG